MVGLIEEDKATEWFDGETTQPGQPGVYERDYGKLIHYRSHTRRCAYWDGTTWFCNSFEKERAVSHYNGRTESINQDLSWRGFKEKQT